MRSFKTFPGIHGQKEKEEEQKEEERGVGNERKKIYEKIERSIFQHSILRRGILSSDCPSILPHASGGSSEVLWISVASGTEPGTVRCVGISEITVPVGFSDKGRQVPPKRLRRGRSRASVGFSQLRSHRAMLDKPKGTKDRQTVEGQVHRIKAWTRPRLQARIPHPCPNVRPQSRPSPL